MEFVSHGHLQQARAKVATANLSFGNTSDNKRIVVLLDCGKTKEELRPALLTHRTHDIITDMEADRQDQLPVVKCMKGKTVKVGGNRVGYSCYGMWKFIPYASRRYDSGELEAALGYIHGH